MDQVWVQLISSVGFPIVVTGYLLQKGSTIITDLTTSINEQTKMIGELKLLMQQVKKAGDQHE